MGPIRRELKHTFQLAAKANLSMKKKKCVLGRVGRFAFDSRDCGIIILDLV